MFCSMFFCFFVDTLDTEKNCTSLCWVACPTHAILSMKRAGLEALKGKTTRLPTPGLLTIGFP